MSVLLTIKRRIYHSFIILLCLGLSACADTQEGRLAQIDSVTNRISGLLGTKSETIPVATHAKESAPKPRSPLIHGFIYNVASADKFVLFYQGKQAGSIKLGEVVKRYADETGMTVLAYTTDHRTLAAFPDSKIADQVVLTKYFGSSGAIKSPSLFLAQFDSYATVITDHDISYLELVKRMNQRADERAAKYNKKYYY